MAFGFGVYFCLGAALARRPRHAPGEDACNDGPYFSRPTGASLEINSRPELDEAILDHVALSASGLKCEVTITSLEDLDPQVVTQECRSNEPDRHTADSARITVGYRLRCGASAEGHRAQAVEKGGFESTASGSFHAEVVVAVVPR